MRPWVSPPELQPDTGTAASISATFDLAGVDVLDRVVHAVAERDDPLDAVGAERGDRERADVERQLGRRHVEEQVAFLAVRVGGAGRLPADDARRGHAGLAEHDVREVHRLEADRLGLDLVGEAAEHHARGRGALRGERLELADDDAGQDLERDLGRLGLDLRARRLEVDGGDGSLEGAELVTRGRERDLERTELRPDQAVAVFPVGTELHRDRVHRAVLGVVLAVEPHLGVALRPVEEVAADDLERVADRDLGARHAEHERRVVGLLPHLGRATGGPYQGKGEADKRQAK